MGAERRQFPRVPEPFSVQYRVAGEVGSWHTVTVINLSAGGLRFRTAEEPLAGGTALQIKVVLPGFREQVSVSALVAWSQLLASGVTEVGVEFQHLDMKTQILLDRLVGFLKKSV